MTNKTATTRAASVAVTVMVEREDGSVRDFCETFTGQDYLTETQFQRVVDGIGGAVLTTVPEYTTADVDTSRMFGGAA